MPYSSLTELALLGGEDLLIQLTDRASPPAGVIDPAVVDQALARADADINVSLAVRYRLPLAGVPAKVVDLASAIALYKLHRFAPDAKVQADYEQALRDLRDIASGVKKLDLAGIEPDSSGAEGVVVSDRPRDLTPDNLRGFI